VWCDIPHALLVVLLVLAEAAFSIALSSSDLEELLNVLKWNLMALHAQDGLIIEIIEVDQGLHDQGPIQLREFDRA